MPLYLLNSTLVIRKAIPHIDILFIVFEKSVSNVLKEGRV